MFYFSAVSVRVRISVGASILTDNLTTLLQLSETKNQGKITNKTLYKLTLTILTLLSHIPGRYHDSYSEGGYGQYDATPFQTVPGSAGPGGGGGGGAGTPGGNASSVPGEQWGVGPVPDHLAHHPAFLAGLGPRGDSANSAHHPASMANQNPDHQKPLLPSAMLAGYTG